MPLPSPAACPMTPIEIGVPDGIITLDIQGDAYFCLYAPQALPAPLRCETRPIEVELPTGDATLDVRAIWSLLLALVRTLVDLRRCSFAELLDHVGSTASRIVPARFDFCPYGRAVAQFERFSLYIPFRFQCLFRAYWLIHFLARRGLRAQWIFGASLFPFEAHCWVVCDGHLLGERAHRLEGLTVLLAVPSQPS